MDQLPSQGYALLTTSTIDFQFGAGAIGLRGMGGMPDVSAQCGLRNLL
jgi:hypothetical protein